MGKRKLNYPNAKNLVVWDEILLFMLPSRDEGYFWLLLKFCVQNFVTKEINMKHYLVSNLLFYQDGWFET